MARKKRGPKKNKNIKRMLFWISSAFLLFISGLGIYHFVNAGTNNLSVEMELDPNIGLEQVVEEFFNANDAPEMIPIIKCESHFKHYNSDGTVLENKEGSSATGITQILSSQHPDPKVLEVFNKRNNAALTVDDFDIETFEGNIAYALALYEVRGTRDWECSKKFRFR